MLIRQDSGKVRVFDIFSSTFEKEMNLHDAFITDIKVFPSGEVLSTDKNGMIELWDLETEDFPSFAKFKYKSATDLLLLAEKKDFPVSASISTTGLFFAVYTNSKQIYVFDSLKGTVLMHLSEQLSCYTANTAELCSNLYYNYDQVELSKKINKEKEVLKSWAFLPEPKIQFDETDNYVFFPSLIGIKQVNFKKKTLKAVLGLPESTERFLSISLLQTKPEKVCF